MGWIYAKTPEVITGIQTLEDAPKRKLGRSRALLAFDTQSGLRPSVIIILISHMDFQALA